MVSRFFERKWRPRTTAYRLRVKFAPNPTSLWRDIVVGTGRTIAEFQSAINSVVGLDQNHLWFIGNDKDYWDSKVKYQWPQEYEQSRGGGSGLRTERLENTGEMTPGEMARQLDLEQYDRICYLYDYSDQWGFYAILKEVLDDELRETEPAVVEIEGESINQYGPSRERRF